MKKIYTPNLGETANLITSKISDNLQGNLKKKKPTYRRIEKFKSGSFNQADLKYLVAGCDFLRIVGDMGINVAMKYFTTGDKELNTKTVKAIMLLKAETGPIYEFLSMYRNNIHAKYSLQRDIANLENMYEIINKPIPSYLEKPLTEFFEAHPRFPKAMIENFELSGRDLHGKWENCGCIDIPAPPTMQERRFFNKIYFGNDRDNLYLRFDINKFILERDNSFKEFNQIYVYFKNGSNPELYDAPIRVASKTESVIPFIKEHYNSEIKLTLFKNYHFDAQLVQAARDNLWVLQIQNGIEYVFEDFLEVKIPFDDLKIKEGETVEFFVIQGPMGVIDDFYPQNALLPVTRPVCVASNV